MASHLDSFSKTLLVELFLRDPRDWRLRQVLQITPVNPEAYRARTSFQFRLSRPLIQEAWETTFRGVSQSLPPVPEDEIGIIIPIDYLPKYVLLDFSLEDASGKPLALLTSGEINELSFEIVRAAMDFLDSKCADGAHTAIEFFQLSRDIIFALISTGQQEVQKRLERLRAFPRDDPQEFAFRSGMLWFYEDALAQFSGQHNLPERIANICRSEFYGMYRAIGKMEPELKWILAGSNGFHSPLLNPALLLTEYLRMQSTSSSNEYDQHIVDFLMKCRQFTEAIVELQADNPRRNPIIEVLWRMSNFYVAYSRIKAPIDRDFVIKMEQLIPVALDDPWWRVWAWHYQNYPIRIGGSRSTHIEVICEHPIELEQIPDATRVIIGKRSLPIDVVFGKTDHSTKYHQHFYTNRTPEQMMLAIQSRGVGLTPRSMFDFTLQIKYAVEAATRWGYRFVILIALLAAILLFRGYDPANLKPGEIPLISLIPILTGLLGVLASLKPQENIVAIATRKYKLSVLAIAFLMAGYFSVGLFYPEAITAVRGGIREALVLVGLR